jgi:hypothetical protein
LQAFYQFSCILKFFFYTIYYMKLPLVLALTTASILAAEEPVESSEIGKT